MSPSAVIIPYVEGPVGTNRTAERTFPKSSIPCAPLLAAILSVFQKAVCVATFVFANPAAAKDSQICQLVAELNRRVELETELEAAPSESICASINWRSAAVSGASPGILEVADYDLDSGAISLWIGLELEDVYAQSVLLHELVHAAQNHSGIGLTAPCNNSLERSAYAVQSSFLDENGLEKEAYLARFMSVFLSKCEHELIE